MSSETYHVPENYVTDPDLVLPATGEALLRIRRSLDEDAEPPITYAAQLQELAEDIKQLVESPPKEPPKPGLVFEAPDESASLTVYRDHTIASLAEAGHIFKIPTRLFQSLLSRELGEED